MPLDGTLLGRYRLIRQLGSGGMGEVYLAEDTRINRQIAIKIVRSEVMPYPNNSALEDATRLFRREMKAISQLDHPRILPLYDYGEETSNGNTITYMVMPYRSAGSLADWLRTHTGARLRPEEVAAIINQAAEALQHAHDRQIIHQDVKPSNFLVHNSSSQSHVPDLLLADFGIAKSTANTSSMSQNVRGTPTYMAPEQWDGHPVAATDQYALGIMAYLLLTGTAPFQGGPGQVMRQHYMSQPVPPSRLDAHISSALDAVVLRALAKKPEERYPSIREFAHTFRQATEKRQQDLHATLAISRQEAEQGTVRTLNLPGQRQVLITVPARAYHDQILRLEGMGEAAYEGGPRSTLLLTIAITEESAAQRPQNTNSYEPTEVAHINPAEQRRPGQSTPSWPIPPNQPRYGEYTPPPPPPVYHAGQAGYPVVSPYETTPSGGGAYPGALQPAMPVRKRNPLSLILLVLVIVLLITAGGIGIFSYNNHARQIYAQATQAASDATAHAVQTTATAQFAATATEQAQDSNPYVSGSSKLLMHDPLSQASTTWQVDPTDNLGGSCTFINNTYHIKETRAGYFRICSAHSTDVSDFVFEVHMQILSGHCGGILFRQLTAGQYYLYRVCADGYYGLTRYVDNTGQNSLSMRYTTSPAIHKGTQENVIAVVAQGTRIHLYVNNKDIDNFDDGNYLHGGLGLIADYNDAVVEVAYSNVRIWNLVV
ncbi:MAG TPA: protein kinase [Ktedonobacteraceae bacterium]|jgi:serine/threonine protein kinase|nr:protein kinase [Ktedonobacteraceae bacterium]